MASSSKPHKSSKGVPKTQSGMQLEEKPSAAKTFCLPADKHLLELNSREDYTSILKDVLDRVVLFEFFANWCGPCKMLAAKLHEIADSYKGKLLIVKIDVDEYEDLALEHNVSAIPTFVIRKDKRFVEMFSNSNAQRLQEILEKFMGKPEEDAKADTSNGADDGNKLPAK